MIMTEKFIETKLRLKRAVFVLLLYRRDLANLQ